MFCVYNKFLLCVLSTLMVTLYTLIATFLYTQGHASLHSWPSLHSWSSFSALMVTLFCTHGHPSSVQPGGCLIVCSCLVATASSVVVWRLLDPVSLVSLEVAGSWLADMSGRLDFRPAAGVSYGILLGVDEKACNVLCVGLDLYTYNKVVVCVLSTLMVTLLYSWSPFFTLMATLLCTHGHPSLQSWSPFSVLMVTLLYTHGHPSLHSWSPFSALMVTLLCTHGHPSLHSWSPFSALMVTLLCTHGHPSRHSWSPFSALMVTVLCTHGYPLCSVWRLFDRLFLFGGYWLLCCSLEIARSSVPGESGGCWFMVGRYVWEIGL